MGYVNRKRFILAVVILLTAIGASAAIALIPHGVTVTAGQRGAIHAKVDAISEQLIAAMGRQIDIDSISYGGALADATAWPFPVRNDVGTGNRNERDRKIRMFEEAVNTARALGFPVVAQRQDDKIVWAEFGDPDAPEMVMALSHLDSPTSSITSPNREHWVDENGQPDPDAYCKFYTRTIGGVTWMYGAGVQDDSGPTVATLYAAKALMDLGFPMDRRIRIAMGGYEDSSPARPTAAQTRSFVNIPYYPAGNPGFFDNWAYKYLFREEMPIACFTSDSRFPVIVGNAVDRSRLISMDLSGDAGKKFALASGERGITSRAGDDTLRWIGDGSGQQQPSQAVFTLALNGASEAETSALVGALSAAMTTEMAGKVRITPTSDRVIIMIDTDVAMEAPTPQYGKNAVVWGMYLLKRASDANAFPDSLALTRAAGDIAAAFMADGAEDYFGAHMGIDPVRRADNGCPYLTVAYGYNVGKTSSDPATAAARATFYSDDTKTLNVDLYIRSMYDVAADYIAAQGRITAAFPASDGWVHGTAPAWSGPTLYLTHDNPLTALQFASYKNTLSAGGFEDLTALLPVSYPQGTTGGTLASDYWNKMNAYGAVLPGNERWWHAANERMSTKAAVQMTKAFADCLLEMARYSGPAGAQFLSADLTGLGLDPSRADLDLLDVTIATYRDAKSALTTADLGGKRLMAATSFVLPMFPAPFTSGRTQAQIDAGHASNGIYLSTSDSDYQSKTFVSPMRLEFKIKKSDLGLRESAWQSLKAKNITDLLSSFQFKVLKNNGTVVSLNELPPGGDIDKYFSRRVSQYDPDALYLTAHVAIVDRIGADLSVSGVVDSRADRYEPANPAVNPWPDRLATTPRGFFLIDDGAKDAEFTSPRAIFVTTSLTADGSSGGGCDAGFGAVGGMAVALLAAVKRRKR